MIFSGTPSAWEKMGAISADKRRIDVWWRGDATSRLMVLFAHMIGQNPFWAHAKIRVLDVSADLAAGDTVSDLGRMLSDIRINAEPEIVASANADAVAAYSEDAALVLLPFRLRQDQPRDVFGNDLSGLMERLPVAAAVLAAEDVDLAAEPEEGPAAEAAAVSDELHDTQKKLKTAEKAAAEASRAADEKLEAFRSALVAGADPEKIKQLNDETVEAKNRAVKTARKATKLAVRVEDLTRRAKALGAEFAPEDKESKT
ncbi:MAG: hypothetical protein ACQERN_08050 [Thermodesulfobacteriota bacterium]